MSLKRFVRFGLPVVAFGVLLTAARAGSKLPQEPVVRLAELEVYPEQVEAYKAALKVEIEAFIRLEAGVLALYAVQ